MILDESGDICDQHAVRHVTGIRTSCFRRFDRDSAGPTLTPTSQARLFLLSWLTDVSITYIICCCKCVDMVPQFRYRNTIVVLRCFKITVSAPMCILSQPFFEAPPAYRPTFQSTVDRLNARAACPRSIVLSYNEFSGIYILLFVVWLQTNKSKGLERQDANVRAIRFSSADASTPRPLLAVIQTVY